MSSLRPVAGTVTGLLDALRGFEAAPSEPEPLTVATSGSTGEPKQVVLCRAALRASADATAARLGGPGQWLLTLPPDHVAGLQVLFRSVRAGTEPVVERPPPARCRPRGGGGRMTGERRYVSVVPTQLRRLLADPDARRPWPASRRCWSAGPACPRSCGPRPGRRRPAGGVVRDERDLRRLRVRRGAARRRRGGPRRRRPDPDRRADAVLGLRRPPRPDRRGAARRLVPHRRTWAGSTRTAGSRSSGAATTWWSPAA